MTDAHPQSTKPTRTTPIRLPKDGYSKSARKTVTAFYVLPFVVIFRDDEWWNARTEEPLDCYIAAWRPMNSL